jgi:RNA polymerase sigma-70 factor (ECF subfamily)
VARLPPSLRTVVALRYFEDKTLAEMITIMGLPPGTVKSQLHRARLRLKEVLSRLFKEGERANEL